MKPDSGSSMNVPVNEPLISGNEQRYVADCISTGWISSEGHYVKRFEEQFATRVNREHGIAVCNGTAALSVALAALRLGPGDEVILPTLTIISCAAAIVRCGAVPVLVDSDPHTWCMDVSQVEGKVTPRTRAIIAVHTYGLPVDMDPLLEIAERYGLFVIEDAAEAHGLNYRGRPCGSFGTVSTFSFYANKHVTSGEGGMVLTNDSDVAARSQLARNLWFDDQRRFVHQELGWNFRMSNIQAAIGLAQLERLDEFAARKHCMGRRYTDGLLGLEAVQLPMPRCDYAENIYWVYGLVLGEDVPFDAATAMQHFAARGSGTRPFFWPMHEQPVFKRMHMFKDERYPVSERLARRGFYLPSGIAITEAQIDYVINATRELLS